MTLINISILNENYKLNILNILYKILLINYNKIKKYSYLS